MSKVIADYGYLAGVCGYDGADWIEALIDAAGHLQVDVVDSGGADLNDLKTLLTDIKTAVEKIDDLRGALDSVGTDELDVNVEATVNPSNLDIALSALRDAICASAPTGRDLNDLYNILDSIEDWLELLDDLRDALHSNAADELDVIFDGQNADVEVTQTTPADLVVGAHQYDGSAWRKSNILFGFNAQWSENVSDLDADAGTNTIYSAAVPANYVYVVTACSAQNNTTDPSLVMIYVDTAAANPRLVKEASPGAATAVVWTGTAILVEDDKLACQFRDCLAGDDLYLEILGYKMRLDM